MARANIAVLKEDQGWVLRLLGGGSSEAPPAVPLRGKPPPDPVSVLELGPMPSPGTLDLAAGPGSPGGNRTQHARQAEAAALAALPLQHQQSAGQAVEVTGQDGVYPLPSPTCMAAAAPEADGKAAQGGGGGFGGGGGDASGREGRSSMVDEEEDADDAQQQQQFDAACASCDDGGNLLVCDGPCMRSFHTGKGSECNLLGLPTDLAELLATTSDTFRCPNCLAGVQQCFICKKEGEENKDVFKCIHASCGRHYHPTCAKVEAGRPFACKLHACKACGQPAEHGSKEGELVPCRRCPQAWHRRCLPQDLPLARDSPPVARVWLADYDEETGEWLDGMETSLLYCKRHSIDPDTKQAKFVRRLRKAAAPGQASGQVREVPYNLIREDLLHGFQLHYARVYRHLASSRQLLAEEADRAKRGRAAEAAGEEAASEEDMPLAAKRRRLVKAGQAKRAWQPPAAAAPAVATAAEGVESPRQQLPADMAAVRSAAMAAAAPAAIPSVQPQPLPERKGQAEAGEPSESSAATEDARELGIEDDGEMHHAGPAGDPAATACRLAAAEADRLEAALEQLVHLPSRQRRAERLQHLLQTAEDDQRLTKDALRMATRRPEPYRHPMKKTIDENRLQSLERSVRYAVDAFRSRQLGEGELMQVLDAGTVRAALAHYDDLLMVLAPYLHGERYSSYGRHFTSHKLLHDVAERLLVFLRNGDQVVDFSCGENYFLPHLKQLCLRNGLAVSGRAYDIILAKDSTDFVLKSWFDAQPWKEGLAPPHQLVIGLNPPFGKNNSLADRFVRKAADFQPRLMVLIVPPRTIIPHGYRVVLENSNMCGGEEFYVPGSTHKSWNKEWPVLRILERQEARGMPAASEEVIDCTALHMHHSFGGGGYLQLGLAAGYQQPFGAHVGEDVYAGYAQHHAQMLQQPYEQPLYGRQASTREWPQTQQPYCGAPPVQPPYRPLQSMQGRGRPQHGGRGSSQHYRGRGRGWGRH